MVDLVFNNQVSSTNDLAMASNKEWQLFMAETQTKGRGQRGNSWESEPKKNLTFSLLLKPDFLHASMQFYISKIVSLAIVYALEENGVDCQIKWPNDIYIKDKKVCGILIENVLSSSAHIQKTVVGVGLNVNQRLFLSDAPNPTSVSLEIGEDLPRHALLNDILLHLYKLYNLIKGGERALIDEQYIKYLYRFKEVSAYKDADGQFMGVIESVSSQGELTIKKVDGKVSNYLFKEVEFLL